MGLTYRSNLNRPLTNTEIDDNFRYFTGSHAITGSLITSGSSTIIGNTTLTGSLITSGSSTTIGNTTLTGSFYLTGSSTIVGDTTITGSFISSGSSFTINNSSGSILTPTASLTGLTPTFNGIDGQFLFGSGSEGYKLFVWMGGAWRSGSLS